MKQSTVSRRFYATEELRREIEAEGRRADWLAQRVGVSKSFLSKVVSQQKTIGEDDARVLAALLNADFPVLFELPDSAKIALPGSERAA